MEEYYTREEVIGLLYAFGANCEQAGKEIQMMSPTPIIEDEKFWWKPDKWIENNLKKK